MNATSNSEGSGFLTILAAVVLVVIVTHLPTGDLQAALDIFQASAAMLGSVLSAVLHLALVPFGF